MNHNFQVTTKTRPFLNREPYIENAGIKQAFRVSCERHVPDKSWQCNKARIQRYIALESQAVEVRLTGPIKSEEALVLIEATRKALPSTLDNGSPTPQTAIMIMLHKGDYLVSSGDTEGHGTLMMHARLPEGADSMKPAEWHASVYWSGKK